MGSSTREVAAGWFSALTGGDAERALGYLADDIEWINYAPVPGYNDRMPWIGTYHGPSEVLASLKVFLGVVDVKEEQLVELVVEGDRAMGVIHEKSVVKKTGQTFEIEFVQQLTVRDGKIVRWKSYTDPSQILRAIDGRAS
ncbi:MULTISPECIES: nuclear transport factor 2 family protein [unclassified Streptomyces]|uniref:nuclear transport factor 2 family protein n=1 Tax=unclassified Streptomyces TaxID=2593676 RepID=UPI00365DDB30